MKKVKVALIGCGAMHAKSSHLPALSELDTVDFRAVCDINEKALNEAVRKYNIPEGFLDYKEMLRKVDLDAVFVILSPLRLYPVVLDCLYAGKHVSVEKPPGKDIFETERMAKVSEERNLKTMVGFNRRFMPVLYKAKNIVEEKGKVFHYVARFYRYRDKVGSDNLKPPVEALIHGIDTLRWLGGEVREVKGFRRSEDGFQRGFNVVLEFESGATGILSNFFLSGNDVEEYEMHSQGISAYVRSNSGYIFYRGIYSPVYLEAKDIIGDDRPDKVSGSFYETKYFIECILNNQEPMPDLKDAIKTMKLAKKIASVSDISW